jgi:hypothetical protein
MRKLRPSKYRGTTLAKHHTVNQNSNAGDFDIKGVK